MIILEQKKFQNENDLQDYLYNKEELGFALVSVTYVPYIMSCSGARGHYDFFWDDCEEPLFVK